MLYGNEEACCLCRDVTLHDKIINGRRALCCDVLEVCQEAFSPYTSPLKTHFVIRNLIRKFNGRSLEAKLKKKKDFG